MAQTALIVRGWIAVLLLLLAESSLGQAPASVRDILDARVTKGLEPASAMEESVDALRCLDALNIGGRHRFILPLPRDQARSGVSGLREALEQFQILDAIAEAIADKAGSDEQSADQAAARGELALTRRLRRRAVGLRSILELPDRPSQEEVAEWPWDSIRVSRAAEPLSLLAWNRGAYSVAETRHFSVASQAGERPTADMAQACELAYEIWSQRFSSRFLSKKIDATDPDEAIDSPRFRVVMFRTRDAYVKALRAIEPKIGVSTGYYSPRHRLSFFYWDGPKSLPTLIHELTHQFFQESSHVPSRFDSDRHPGFWALEGVALYMESLSMRRVGGAIVIDLGGWDSPRLQAGRYRRLHDETWIPWNQFSALNGEAFRNSKDIAVWYSQACGLAHRWLDGSEEEAKHFSEYLSAVYAGKGAEASQRLAIDDGSMRTGYDQYLMTSWRSDDPSESRPFFPNRRETVLSRCKVTSRDLLAWPARCRAMDWLDLSFSSVDDAWLVEAREPAWKIQRLNLESTATTDVAMERIASMRELKELDLTDCKITDRGVEVLREHPNLRQLWLDRTQITDASIETLLSLPRLERLALEGSGLSEAGRRSILAKKPFLIR